MYLYVCLNHVQTEYDSLEVDRYFKGAYCLHHEGDTSETPVHSNEMHGAVFQKAVIFMIAAVRIWNLKCSDYYLTSFYLHIL
jgi:hypothetical protein